MAGNSKAASSKEANAKTGPEGSQNFKEGAEKVMDSYGQLTDFNKEIIEAMVSSANITSRGLEVLNNEAVVFSKQSMEEGVAVAKAAMSARSVQELIEIQTNFTKSIFDVYLGQVNRVADLVAGTTKEAVEPLNDRFNVLLGLVQSVRP